MTRWRKNIWAGVGSIRDAQAALRRVTLAGKGVPVLYGAALRNRGIQPLLDAVVDYLPAPTEVPITGHNPRSGEEQKRRRTIRRRCARWRSR